MAEADWKYLQYNIETGQKRTGDGPSGGSSTFAGLEDVNLSNLQNGQVPKYNSTTHKWENANESGGGGTVTDVEVDGVSVVNPQTGVAEIEMPTPPTIPIEDVEVNGESVVNAQKVAEIKSYKEVTQAEYNALPDSKLNDGILYAIKDSAGADGFPPLIYSDEEREVGVWRDGKPLYQKTITILPSALQPADNDLPISLPNMETFVRGFGTLKRSNGWGVAIPNSYGSTDWNIGIFNVRENMFDFWIGSSALSLASVVYITFQYTKTTDTAGSGTWTTQGALAHHYSTEEHIIGTWIDGKPLYEKSYVTSQFSGDYDITTDIPFDGAFVVSGYYLLNDSNGSMIGLNEWFASANYSFCHVEKATKKIRCYLMGYTGIGYFTIQYTKTTD